MKILLPFGIAFGGLIMLTLLPNKTILTTILAIGMILGGIGMTFYNSSHRGY